MYPLSASHAAEGAKKDEDIAVQVGRAFFWQIPGMMAPYAVSLVLLLTIGNTQCLSVDSESICDAATISTVQSADTNASECVWDNSTQVCAYSAEADFFVPSFGFQLLTGLGAVPALIV